MKKCSTCREVRSLDDFSKDRSRTDGRSYVCKSCQSISSKKYRTAHSDKINAQNRIYEQKAKKKIKNRKKAYYEKNKERILTRNRVWARANKKKAQDQQNKRARERSKTDPLYRLRKNIRTSMRRYLIRKQKKTSEIIGCSWLELWHHLCNSFEANYGMPRSWLEAFEYDIDHIIPIGSGSSVEELMRLGHFSNLQILLREDNQTKGVKLDYTL